MVLLQQFLSALGFFTRLPLPRWTQSDVVLAQTAWAFPLAGILVGLLTGALCWLLLSLGLPAGLAAWLALAAQLLLTGGLHEDGLADMADAMAFGRNREEKLAIMRDSRIGSYGVLALILCLVIRAEAITVLANRNELFWPLITAGAFSRSSIAILMHVLPPARKDGMAVMAGQVARPQAVFALLLGLICLLPVHHSLSALFVAALACGSIGYAAKKQFNGITGDVIGAAQQVCEAGILVALAAG